MVYRHTCKQITQTHNMATSALCSQNTMNFVMDGGPPWHHLLLPCPERSFQSGNALCPSLHHLVWGAVCVFSGNSPLSWSSSNGGHCVVLPARKHHELYHSQRQPQRLCTGRAPVPSLQPERWAPHGRGWAFDMLERGGNLSLFQETIFRCHIFPFGYQFWRHWSS